MPPQPPRPFVSDGASGFISFFCWILFKKKLSWEALALKHDRAYWQGGPLELRKIADQEIHQGLVLHYGVKTQALFGLLRMNLRVRTRLGYWLRIVWYSLIPDVVYRGVRLGGVYWINFPSARSYDGRWHLELNGVRWGYGWKYPMYQQ